jgi:hypothetical protein
MDEANLVVIDALSTTAISHPREALQTIFFSGDYFCNNQ